MKIIELPAAIFSLHIFTSKDESRVALQHIQVEITDGKGYAIATDGYKLVKLDFDAQAADCTFFINQTTAKQVEKMVKKEGSVLYDVDTATLQVNGISLKLNNNYFDVTTYPPWSAIAKTNCKEQKSEVALNVDYLLDVLKFAKKFSTATSKEARRVDFRLLDEWNPVFLNSKLVGGCTMQALLMPIRW